IRLRTSQRWCNRRGLRAESLVMLIRRFAFDPPGPAALGRSANRPGVVAITLLCPRNRLQSSFRFFRKDRFSWAPTTTGTEASAAPRSGPARVALGARAAAHERHLPALPARVAFVALQPGQVNLFLQRLGGAGLLGTGLVAVAVIRQRP